MQHLTHWDDLEPRRREAGHIAGSWRDLGSAAGTVGVGVKLVDVDPGRWSTPAHVEGAAEEIFYVLAGSGLSWQDGVVYDVRAGDCLVHLPEGRLPGGRGESRLPGLRNPRAERHRLLPALRKGQHPRGRPHRADRAARLLGRRGVTSTPTLTLGGSWPSP